MSAPFEELSTLDRLIHEPARLSILSALAACRRADFLFLQSVTGLTKGNLSNHLTKLEQAGLVRIEKAFRGRVPITSVHSTPQGRRGIERHWRRLEELRKATRAWRRSDHQVATDPSSA